MKIAFLGTGLMGLPMARRLVAAGHDLKIWNRSPARAEPLSAITEICRTPADAASDAKIVISMLIDGSATRSVLQDQGVLSAMQPGAMIIDMGSVDPATDRELANLAGELGLGYIDAPVSGGVVGAEAGMLAIFVGGEVALACRAEPVLKEMGQPTHLGPIGAGQIAKLANQVIVATTIGAVAEAFHLAQAGGCELTALRAALMGGFADSRILDLHGARMIAGNYVPGGRSAAQLKDLDNAVAQAAATAVSLPLAKTARDAFHDLVEWHDGAEMDHSAYFHWLSVRRPSSEG